jgi:phospholipid-binding lipoprotein MlaA
MRRLLVGVAAGAVLAGCATAPPAAGGTGNAPIANPADPWESFNRKVYNFNDALDRDILKPVAQTYRRVVPQLVRTGVSNVFGNVYDAWSTINQFLQGKVQYGFEMGMRVATNTFFGIGGLLDPATEAGLVRRSEDFGQTLGVWGVGPGPYLVLPLFGPSTLRDGAAFVVDRQLSPAQLVGDDAGRYAVASLEVVAIRTDLLGATQLLDEAALDRYSFVRDAWLARRRDLVYDGAAPPEPSDDEPADAPPGGAAAAAPAASQPASAPAK